MYIKDQDDEGAAMTVWRPKNREVRLNIGQATYGDQRRPLDFERGDVKKMTVE
jgi:hypothetical protein